MASTGQQQQQRPGQGPNNAGNGAKGRPNRWTGSHNFGGGNASNHQGNQAGNHQGNSRTASPANNVAARGPSTSNSAAPAGLTALSNEDHAKLHDRMLYLLVNMIGTKVRVTVKSGPTWSGILSSTSDTELSVHLKAARQLQNDIPQNPPKSLLIQAKDIVQIQADKVDFDTKPGTAPGSSQSRPVSPQSAAEINSIGALLDAAAASKDKFRTDTDISGAGAGKERRELQKWGAGNTLLGDGADGAIGGSSLEDDDGLLEPPSRNFAGNGQNSSSGKWDQFATNEKLFGAKTNYQEEIYTTKLDKSGANFKAKEARAIKLANEILTGVSSNAHVAEERGQIVNDDTGMDEEDKYSGVLRGPNAYVPPGARRTMAAAVAGGPSPLTAKSSAPASQQVVPSSNASAAPTAPSSEKQPNGSASAKAEQAVPAEATNKAVPDVNVTPTTANDQPAAQAQTSDKVVEDFRKFVGTEKEKMIQKKQQLVQKQKEDRIADLRAFSKAFTLKSAVPADLVPLLAKDEAKQRELASRKVSAASAAPSAQSSTTSTIKPSASTVASPNLGAAVVPSKTVALAAVASPSGTPAKKPSPYALAAIPAFDPVKAAAARAAKAGLASPQPSAAATPTASTSTSTTKFNAAAPAFVFRPGAASFQPGASPAPAPAAEAAAAAAPPTIAVPAVAPAVPVQPAAPANPFFGTAIHRSSPRDKLLHVKEDFSPFKRTTGVPAPEVVSQEWGFTGKSFRSIGSPTGAVTSSASVSNVSSPMPAHANVPTPTMMQTIAPQQGTAIPAQFYQQQQQHQLPHHPHAHPQHQSNLSNASSASGRNLNVRSPPPTSLMSRSPSNAGTMPSSLSTNTLSTATDDGSSQRSSTVPTPVPSSSTSQAGVSTMPSHNMAHAGQQGQQPHMLPQGYAMYQNYQAGLQAGAPYRFAPGANMPQPQQAGAQHGHIQQQQQSGQPNQQIHHFAVPHGNHMPFPPQQGYVAQMPFSPQALHATQPMFSPQLANQMPAGQMYHPSMFVQQQGGARGQQTGPHMPGVPQQQYYYQHIPQQGGMPGQFMAVPSQGMQMPTPQMQPQAQPVYEQGA